MSEMDKPAYVDFALQDKLFLAHELASRTPCGYIYPRLMLYRKIKSTSENRGAF